MENEDVIRHQMEDTRTSLTEKLENLEHQVVNKVQEATTAVSETVASVTESFQDTVTSVKDSVENTVTRVKDSVHDTVSAVQDTVRNCLNVKDHVDKHPWLMVGGSMCLGYVLGNLLGSRPRSAGASPQPRQVPRLAHSNGGPRAKDQASSSTSESLLGSEVTKLKGLVLGALLGTFREAICQAVPEHMGSQLREVIDNVTNKIGGDPTANLDWAGEGHQGATTQEQQSR